MFYVFSHITSNILSNMSFCLVLTSCWGPELSTAIYRLELGSGITHLDLELASVLEGKEKEKEKYARKQVWSKYIEIQQPSRGEQMM